MPDKAMTRVINRSLVGVDDDRAGHTYLHVSDLRDFCPRAYVLSKKHDAPLRVNKRFPENIMYTFRLGVKIQEILEDVLREQDSLVTTWRCRCCGFRAFGFPPGECSSCKAPAAALSAVDTLLELQYNGIPVKGSVDMFFAKNMKTVYPVECKSEKAESFAARTEPDWIHVRQLALYMWMLNKQAELARGVNTGVSTSWEKGIVAYFSKGAQKPPYKLYTVLYSERKIQRFLVDVEKRLNEIKPKARKLPKAICASALNPMAKDCPMRRECFSKE